MASFTKRGSTWQYTISRMIDGKSKPIRKGGFKTKKEAQVAAAIVEDQLRNNKNPFPDKIIFHEYFEKWIKLYKHDVAHATKLHYQRTLNTVKEYFGDKDIKTITKTDYQLFLNEYGSTRAKETIEKLHTQIRGCVLDALDEKIIDVDFTRRAKLTYANEAKAKEEKVLDFIEAKRLLIEVYNRLEDGLGYYIILLALTSGMRFSELVGLTRQDFDFKNMTISVNKTWYYSRGAVPGFGPTKNQQSNRVIKMDQRTMKAFYNLFKKLPYNINQLVFFSPNSKYKVLSNTLANKLLKKMLIELNIDNIVTVHALRHTHASILLYKGISIYYVSERLGHQNIDTTLKYYSHVIKELRTKDELAATNYFNQMLV